MKNTHGDYIKILWKKGMEKRAHPQLLCIQRLIGDALCSIGLGRNLR